MVKQRLNFKIYRNIIKKMGDQTQTDIAVKCGMSTANFSKFLGNLEKGRGITTSSLASIAEGLGVEPWELLK